jgi:uncharacterized protein
MPATLFWRRIDVPGLERMEVAAGPDCITAQSTVISLGEGGFRLDHRWLLDRQWRTKSVTVDRWNAQGHGRLLLERDGSGWRVDGTHRPDLDGAEEPDLSETPFCNSFPIRRLPDPPGATLTLDTAYIDGPALTVARSRQSYVRQGPHAVRYIDLGLSAGFEADIEVDEEGLVLRYQHLFERVAPST